VADDVVQARVIAVVVAEGGRLAVAVLADPQLGDGAAAVVVGGVIGKAAEQVLDLFLIPQPPDLFCRRQGRFKLRQGALLL
jgi:hypothetical protein